MGLPSRRLCQKPYYIVLLNSYFSAAKFSPIMMAIILINAERMKARKYIT